MIFHETRLVLRVRCSINIQVSARNHRRIRQGNIFSGKRLRVCMAFLWDGIILFVIGYRVGRSDKMLKMCTTVDGNIRFISAKKLIKYGSSYKITVKSSIFTVF